MKNSGSCDLPAGPVIEPVPGNMGVDIKSVPAMAPIAVFAFKRPVHLRRTLESLARNPEFTQSELHIFCDGARRPDEEEAVAEAREIARGWPHPAKTVHVAASNLGLAASVIAGVSALCAKHGRVIVVEDDLIVATVFLDFMNRCLEHYSADQRVMQISGHMFPVEIRLAGGDVIFLPFTTSWGWATWSHAWARFDPQMAGYERLALDRYMRRAFNLQGAYPYFSMLKKQRSGAIDSWAIRWYLSVFFNSGIVVYPKRSLVGNEGFDGSGTNCAATDRLENSKAVVSKIAPTKLVSAAIDSDNLKAVTNFLRSQNSLWLRANRFIRRKMS